MSPLGVGDIYSFALGEKRRLLAVFRFQLPSIWSSPLVDPGRLSHHWCRHISRISGFLQITRKSRKCCWKQICSTRKSAFN